MVIQKYDQRYRESILPILTSEWRHGEVGSLFHNGELTVHFSVKMVEGFAHKFGLIILCRAKFALD